MRILLLSDIHANLEALDSALSQTPFDALWVLGDLVGYGADPNPVVERIQELKPDQILRGNHDKVCSGLENADDFSLLARLAAEWTEQNLRPEIRKYLQELPAGPLDSRGFLLCHGSPLDEDEYLFSTSQTTGLFHRFSEQVCFFGHTHLPVIYSLREGKVDGLHVSDSHKMTLDPPCRYLINPGSVGQPRDGDPRGSLVVLDTPGNTLEFIKFSYPIERAAEKIRQAGLPPALADRLRVGR